MLLNYPDRLHPGEEYRDGEVPVYGSLSDVKSLPTESNMLVKSKGLLQTYELDPGNDNTFVLTTIN